MNILHLIGLISGALLIAFGFVHFLILDKLFLGKPNYLRMKWWAGKITVALTIIFFGCGIAMLTIFLFK